MDVAVFACVFQMVAHIIYHHMRDSGSNPYRPSLPFLSPSQTKTTSPQETSPGDVVLLDGSPDFTVRATSQIFRVGFYTEIREMEFNVKGFHHLRVHWTASALI